MWKEKAAETEAAAAAAAAAAAYQQIDTLMMRKHHPREKFYLVLITDGTLILALIGTQLEMSDMMKLCCKTRCLNTRATTGSLKLAGPGQFNVAS